MCHGNRMSWGARCVKNAADRLHRAPNFVIPIAGTTMRNALPRSWTGRLAQLLRRLHPLRGLRFKPVLVCRATMPLSTPIGV